MGEGHADEAKASDHRLTIDTQARRIVLDDRVVGLSAIEFAILAVLSDKPDGITTYDELITGVWGTSEYFDQHALEVQVSRLRKKLGESSRAPHFIETIRGVGYRFASSGSDEHMASLVYDSEMRIVQAWLKDDPVFASVPEHLIGSTWLPTFDAHHSLHVDRVRWLAQHLHAQGTRESRLLIDLDSAADRSITMQVLVTWHDADGRFDGVDAELFKTDLKVLRRPEG